MGAARKIEEALQWLRVWWHCLLHFHNPGAIIRFFGGMKRTERFCWTCRHGNKSVQEVMYGQK